MAPGSHWDQTHNAQQTAVRIPPAPCLCALPCLCHLQSAAIAIFITAVLRGVSPALHTPGAEQLISTGHMLIPWLELQSPTGSAQSGSVPQQLTRGHPNQK